MTELQEKELELLKHFANVCSELSLSYFAVCGTALGAVKYSGFIPWDDDVDVAMYRVDYERFLREAPALIPKYIFIQNYRTDPAFPQVFTKLRDNRTTYIEKAAAKLPIHHGVAIDIFPLDGYPRSTLRIRLFEIQKRFFSSALRSAYDVPTHSLLWRVHRFFGLHRHTTELAARYEHLIASYSVNGSRFVCNHGNWQGVLDYSPPEEFGDGARMSFEGLSVLIPTQYDEYLHRKYGDYLSEPPPERRKSHHDCLVCDVFLPYTNYLEKCVGHGKESNYE